MVHLMSASIMPARGAQVLAELIVLALGLELGTPTTPCFLGVCRVEMGDTLSKSEGYIQPVHIHRRSAITEDQQMTEITFTGSEFASLKDNVIIVTGKYHI
jgi:hypothetical protein